MTTTSYCLWPSEQLSCHEYMYVFRRQSCMCVPVQLCAVVCVCACGKGCQLFCVGGLYWMWQESPTGASGTWQSAAGPLLAYKRKVTAGKTNQTLPPPPIPPHSPVSFQMTVRDFLPKGRSQLIAVNETIMAGRWRHLEMLALFLFFFSFLLFYSLVLL